MAMDELAWHSPKEKPFHLAGFAWFEEDRLYRRMPLKPEDNLPEAVDNLANCTAGGQIRFQTDSRRAAVRVRLPRAADMDHMPATGQCGFDLYAGPPGRQRYWSTVRCDHRQTSYEYMLMDVKDKRSRNLTLNFPLYMGVEEALVGLEPHAQVTGPPAYAIDGRVVAYGTSITQGGCASRPGMAWTNVVARRLNVEVVNLGFSGSGKGEPEVARTIAEIEAPALFILDYEANCVSTELLTRTFPEFIRILRARHAGTPILCVSRTAFARDLFNEEAFQQRIERGAFQKKVVDDLRAAGDANLRFLDGSAFLGDDFDECTVDGSHPTDLGFMRIADAMTPAVKEMLII